MKNMLPYHDLFNILGDLMYHIPESSCNDFHTITQELIAYLLFVCICMEYFILF